MYWQSKAGGCEESAYTTHMKVSKEYHGESKAANDNEIISSPAGRHACMPWQLSSLISLRNEDSGQPEP